MFHSEYHEQHKLAFRWIMIAGAAIIALSLAAVVFLTDRSQQVDVTSNQFQYQDENIEVAPMTTEEQENLIIRLNEADEGVPEDERTTSENYESLLDRLEQADNYEETSF